MIPFTTNAVSEIIAVSEILATELLLISSPSSTSGGNRAFEESSPTPPIITPVRDEMHKVVLLSDFLFSSFEIELYLADGLPSILWRPALGVGELYAADDFVPVHVPSPVTQVRPVALPNDCVSCDSPCHMLSVGSLVGRGCILQGALQHGDAIIDPPQPCQSEGCA